MAAEADPLDQAADEHVGPHLAHRPCGGVVEGEELADAIASERRRSRRAGPVIVPVDVRNWTVLVPPDAPAIVFDILESMRRGSA